MRQRYLQGLGVHGFHRLAYTEWGDPANPQVLVCVHGLTRTGRDFDHVARRLADRWRVVCPDMPGRGESEWLPVAGAYSMPTYLADCAALLARLDVTEVDWLGTSMGGIIGIHLAAQPGTPIRRLIINDVGPFIPADGLRRIAWAVGTNPRFADRDAAEAYLRQAMATFGVTRADHWRHLVDISTRSAGDGLQLHYDPAIGTAMRENDIEDVEFWPAWSAVNCPVLVLRGKDSDILSAETARGMVADRRQATLVEFPGCGHAPTLMDDGQIDVIDTWLSGRP